MLLENSLVIDALYSKMKPYLPLLLFVVCSAFAKAQSIDTLLQRYNTHSVPYISVQELKMDYDRFTVLDTRKWEEFEVSHLPNAIWVGDDVDNLDSFNREDPVVVYCTVGVRSEDYGEKLIDAGFKDVRNVYGSIFAWKDAGYHVVDSSGAVTENVHTFSKAWAKYLKTGRPVQGKI
jgi:rhodanese-related sulfurtransferase